MTEKNFLGDREYSLEEEYFRRKDRELIEKMRAAAAVEAARAEMEKRSGVHDPEVLKELDELGFTPETLVLLPLIPLVQVAWAEGGISDAERHLLIKAARARGIDEGTAADRQLAEWLTHRPSDRVFVNAGRLIRAVMAAPGHEDLKVDDLVKQAEAIAAASGGMLGIIGRISAEERAILTNLAAQLKGRA
jgi:hypothetical protein